MEHREEKIGGYLVSDIACCIGKNKELYLKRFRDIESKRMTFNFSAAFCSNYWLAYRLMLVGAVALTILADVVYIFLPYLIVKGLGWGPGTDAVILFFSSLLLAIGILFMGFFGDRLYWWHVKRLLNSYKCKEQPADSDTQAELRQRGGTSVMIIVICMFFQGTVSLIFTKILSSLL